MRTPRTLHIGIVGLGAIGRTHVRVLRIADPTVVLSAVDPGAGAAAAARSLGITHYSDLDDMLDGARPDAVVVAAPTDDHLAIASACIARGIPVLVEKPIAANVADAALLTRRAAEAGVPLLVGHHRRYNPVVQDAARHVARGEIGRVTAVTVMYASRKPDTYFDIPWHREPQGGGPILINLIHEIDQLRFILGEIVSVQAIASSGVRHLPVEDTAVVLLRFASGALGTISLSDCVASPWSYDLVSGEFDLIADRPGLIGRGTDDTHFIMGTEGSLTLPRLRRFRFGGEPGWHQPLEVREAGRVGANVYALQAAHFLDVVTGAASPRVTGEDATRSLAVTLAIKEAAATGREVPVPDGIVPSP
ncbi:Gfo/Idh/MocA family protein [Methylobacterium aquaticum]|uniref:Gfo/Idh/MocA family protein n=1 Tax=Methylobacterium aquaticum TaxID=270351 RepID=UPI00069F7309|nr:Gfo/Idh/MocA family oxidoreductase [Methylobacterium aquaticum]